MYKEIVSRLKKFSKNEHGSSTVEAVLWLPVLFGFLVFVADTSFIFFGQNQTHRFVQDANRQLSIGRLQTGLDVQEFVTAALSDSAPNAVVTSVINDGIVTTSVRLPASDLVAVGIIPALKNVEMVVSSSQYVEY